MTLGLAQRQVALAGAALLAGVVALAVVSELRATRPAATALPPAVGTYSALVGAAGPETVGRRTACGVTLGIDTLGIAHPTLPCGTELYLRFKGRRVLTEVVDRGPYSPGRQFDVTSGLARLLDLSGVQRLQWSYARIG